MGVLSVNDSVDVTDTVVWATNVKISVRISLVVEVTRTVSVAEIVVVGTGILRQEQPLERAIDAKGLR